MFKNSWQIVVAAFLSFLLFVASPLAFSKPIPTHNFLSSETDPNLQDPWVRVIAKAVEEGVSYYTNFGEFLVLEITTPADKNLDHQSNYLSAVGSYNGGKVFLVDHMESVIEDWTTNKDGNWDMQQWAITVSNEGEVLRFQRNYLVKTKDGRVLGSGRITVTEAEAKAKWAELKSGWIKYAEDKSAAVTPKKNATALERWMRLIQKTLDDGEKVDTKIGIYHSLSKVSPTDTTQDHVAHYFSAVGNYGQDRVALVNRVDIVHETWVKTEDGGWAVDQWTFQGTSTGEFVAGRRNILTKYKNGTRKNWETIQTTQAEIDVKWNELKALWLNIANQD